MSVSRAVLDRDRSSPRGCVKGSKCLRAPARTWLGMITSRFGSADPLSAAVGSGVLWVWNLENHNGYRDGVQIESWDANGFFSVQLICMASGLIASALSEIEGQSTRT